MNKKPCSTMKRFDILQNVFYFDTEVNSIFTNKTFNSMISKYFHRKVFMLVSSSNFF